MMSVPRNVRISVASFLLASTIASQATNAADLPSLAPPPMPVAAPEAVLAESGWYLRGDFTESFFDAPRDDTPPDPKDPGMPPLVGLRLSDAPGYGGGVGYRVNDWLRFDLTIDQRSPSRFAAYSSRSNFVTGYNVEAGKLNVLTGLANVYADLGTWWGLTPYIGGGVGFADKGFRANYTQTTCLLEACDGTPGTGPRTAAFRPNRSVSSFAWALTAGVSYRIGLGLSVDAAYRYVDLGKAKSGIDEYGQGTRLKDLAANEFRIGLRYQFGNTLFPAIASNPYGN